MLQDGLEKQQEMAQDRNAFRTLMQDGADAQRTQEKQQIHDRNAFRTLMQDGADALRAQEKQQTQDRNASFRTLMQDGADALRAQEKQQTQDRNAFRNLMQDGADAQRALETAQKATFMRAMHAPFDQMLNDLKTFQDSGYAEFDTVLHKDIVDAFNAYMGTPPSTRPPGKPTSSPPPPVLQPMRGVLYSLAELLIPMPGTAGKTVAVAASRLRTVKMVAKVGSYLSKDTTYEQKVDVLDRIMDTYIPDINYLGFVWNQIQGVAPAAAEAIDIGTSFNPVYQGFVASGSHPTRHWTNGVWKMGLGEGTVDWIDTFF
jgi:hypothetical protein